MTPELEAKLAEMAAQTGRATDELVRDAMVGYFEELAQVRDMLDRRYDEFKSGKVKLVDGEAFFEGLQQREDRLLKQRSSR